MRQSWIRVLSLLGGAITLGVVVHGCSGTGEIRDPLALPPAPLAAPLPETAALEAGAALQLNLAAEFVALRSEFEALKRSGGWRERGYFDAQEQEAISGLLFRFVVNHSSFWNELDRRGGPELAGVGEADALPAHVLALHAGLALADSSSFLVATFIDDPIAIAKINEPFYRYEIPARTYDRLRLSITSRQREELWDAAWQLHEQQLSDPDAGLSALAAQHPAFATLLGELEGLHDGAIAQLRVVRDHEARGPDDVDQTLRHSSAAELGRGTARKLGDVSYAMRSLIFKDVSRVKSPTAHSIRFSPEQKQQIHALLRPGDILLTYTAGYISDVFIPGNFKHGITYVGSAEQRAVAGITPASAPDLPPHELQRLRTNLARDVLADGRRADLIEAVAEGVKFSNLDLILDTHVNRLLVLRPLLSDEERAEFLAGIFSFLGDSYDFRFDFADASRQVCTEVIYRALNEKGDIQFTLTPRAGHPTLSADDVVDYYLSSQPQGFDLILFAEEDPDAGDHRAGVWVSAEAERRVSDRMKAPQG